MAATLIRLSRLPLHVGVGSYLEGVLPRERITPWARPQPLPAELAETPGVLQALEEQRVQARPGFWSRLPDGRSLWAVHVPRFLRGDLVLVWEISGSRLPEYMQPGGRLASLGSGGSTGGGGPPPGAPPANAMAQGALVEFLGTYKQRWAHEQAGDYLRNVYPDERSTPWSPFGRVPPDLQQVPELGSLLSSLNLAGRRGSYARLRDGRALWVVLEDQTDLKHLLHVFLITPSSGSSTSSGSSGGGLPPGAPPANAFTLAFSRLARRGA